MCFTETCRKVTACERLPISVMCIGWYKGMKTVPCIVNSFAASTNILGKEDSTGSEYRLVADSWEQSMKEDSILLICFDVSNGKQ